MQYAIEVYPTQGGMIGIKSEGHDGRDQIICIDPIHLDTFINAINNAADDIALSDEIARENGDLT